MEQVKEDIKSMDNHSSTMNGHSNGPNFFDQIARTEATSDPDRLRECFDHFDEDGDGNLNRAEFDNMLHQLFSNCGKPYKLKEVQLSSMFKLMDDNQDDLIDIEEFQVVWFHWFKQILDPVSAFLLVDVQNDFISGSLSISHCPAKHDGEDVVPVINKLLDTVDFHTVVYTLDWHPENHISFINNVKSRPLHHTSEVKAEDAQTLDCVVFEGLREGEVTMQKLWPRHCVQETWGAELHGNLKVVDKSFVIKKGLNPEVDSYSAFWDNNKLSKTNLEGQLTEMGVTDVYVCGIAYDVCVGATAKHALEHGFRTILVEDASRGVSMEDIDATKKFLTGKGAVILDSDRVKIMVKALDRRPEIGYQAALNVALARRLVKADQRGQTRLPNQCDKSRSSHHQQRDVTIQY